MYSDLPNILLFILSIILAFYIPGFLFIRKIHVPFFAKTIFSLITGMILWAWQGMILGYFNIRWASYLYLLISLILWIFLYAKNFKKLHLPKIKFTKIDYALFSLILTGTLIQLIFSFANGIITTKGMYFCCGGADSLAHLAITSEIIRSFPPHNPGISGVIMHNYHYWSNLIAAEIVRVFHLPLIAVENQYLTIFISALIGLSALAFTQTLGLSKKYSLWLIFFLYFSGDITYILMALLGKGFSFNFPFLENAAWLWISPPRVFAIPIFFAGLSMLSIWLKTKKILPAILMAILFSSLMGIKIYVGIFAVFGLTILTLWLLIKKNYLSLIPLFLTALLSAIIYLPVNSGSGGLLYSGFWRFENFIVQPKLGLDRLELARQIYVAHNNWLHNAFQETIYIFLFFFFLFGTILIGLIQTKKSLSLLPKEINIFLISGTFVCLIFGSFFIQKTGGTNTSQFLITIDILFSIYAALTSYYFLQKTKNPYKPVLIILIIALTIPRILEQSYTGIKKIKNHSGFIISKNELAALYYLNTHTSQNSTLLIDNINHSPKTNTNNWHSINSYYINFLGGHSLFIDGIGGIASNWSGPADQREKAAKIILLSKNSSAVKKSLEKNKINYIYLSANSNLPAKLPPGFLTTFYKNNEIKILKINADTKTKNQTIKIE